MRFITVIAPLLIGSVTAGLVAPPEPQREVRYRSAEPEFEHDTTPVEDLWKRRGGGGGGGGRGGGSGGSSGGRGGGSSGGSRGGSNSGTNTKGNSNTGGYSRDGTGPQPGFVGGQYYAGGSSVPYPAGGSPPGRSLNSYSATPGGLAFYPGFWPYGGFYYPYAYSHTYRNRTSNRDETRDIVCVCARYSVCACDDIDKKDFYDELIKDGDYDKLNKSMVTVSRVNGTQKIVINGTLPNGTTVPTDDEDLYEMYLNGAVTLAKSLGYWPAGAAVMAAVLLA